MGSRKAYAERRTRISGYFSEEQLGHAGCPYGCISNLPKGATSFTTIELKSNFLGTAREGTLECTARPEHAGRTTQVWGATVVHRETGKTIALFRCTQLVIYPK